MNRKIKFRGKRKEDGKWIFGYYIGKCAENTRKKESIISINNNIEYEIIPNTISQFTGFLDKNGKEIYEDDIVKITFQGISTIREVIYCNHDFTWKLFSKILKEKSNPQNYDSHYFSNPYLNLSDIFHNYSNSIEIIGNIYENPKLLK